MSSEPRIAVLLFPGSNGDHDCLYLFNEVLKVKAELVWHGSTSLEGFDAAILPGGFAYGDYLRCGAIAGFSPIIPALREFAAAGKPVLGICNGFQVLTEIGLLPGALLRNSELSFTCRWINVRVEPGRENPFTSSTPTGAIWRLPIAHGEGRYYADDSTLAALNANGQVLLRYCDENGNVGDNFNPNGSSDHIAGVCNEAGNVMGLMPHPERAGEELIGGADGLYMLRALVAACRNSSTLRETISA